jgi:septal ring factor EnvC (AmiA/AmiB activator)
MNGMYRIKLKWINKTTIIILMLVGLLFGSILIGTLYKNERTEGFEATSVCISDPSKNGITDINKSVTKVSDSVIAGNKTMDELKKTLDDTSKNVSSIQTDVKKIQSNVEKIQTNVDYSNTKLDTLLSRSSPK